MGKINISDLKLWIKRQKFIRKIAGAKKEGFFGRLITNGTAGIDMIASSASKNTTAHKAEVKMNLELCMEAAAEYLKMGTIVDLGPLGKLVPGVSSPWCEDIDDLKLKDMVLKINFRPSEDLDNFFHGKLHWLTEDSVPTDTTLDEDEEPDIIDNTTTDTSTGTIDSSTVDTSTGDNGGGGGSTGDGAND